MDFCVIMDSCGDMSKEWEELSYIIRVPLTLRMGTRELVDDGSHSQEEILDLIRNSESCPKSACPAPGEYLNYFEKNAGKRIYVITGTSSLSGSYNSAKNAERMFLEDFPDEQIAVFDSKSATAGETRLVQRILSWEEEKLDFTKVCSLLQREIETQKLRFVLEDLSFLHSSGRLKGVKYLLANKLNIMPILAATEEGTIVEVGKARGKANAMRKLFSKIEAAFMERDSVKVVISHCSCLDEAKELKKKIIELNKSVQITIVATGGIATLYAGYKGIVVAF